MNINLVSITAFGPATPATIAYQVVMIYSAAGRTEIKEVTAPKVSVAADEEEDGHKMPCMP